MIREQVFFSYSYFLYREVFKLVNFLFYFYSKVISLSYQIVSNDYCENFPSFFVVRDSPVISIFAVSVGSIDSTPETQRKAQTSSPLSSNFQSSHFIQLDHLSQLNNLSIFFLSVSVIAHEHLSLPKGDELSDLISSNNFLSSFVISQHFQIVLIYCYFRLTFTKVLQFMISLKLFLYPIIVMLGALALFAYRNVKKTISKYRKYYEMEHDPSWDGFIRTDFNRWAETNIIFGSIVRFPFKTVILLTYFTLVGLAILISFWFKKIGGKIQYFVVRKVCRFLLSLVITIEQEDAQKVSTAMLISNHVCWIDVVYLVTRIYPLSFVAKEGISHVFLIGPIAKYLECIFVSRKSQEARKQVLKDIQQRMKDFSEKNDVNPLLIFPEATTSNGKSILQFKKGAFMTKPEISIFGLIYTCEGFEMGMDEVTPLQHFIISMSLSPKLKVRMCKMIARQQQTPEAYMKRCQVKMSEITCFKVYSGGYKEKCSWGDRRQQKMQ